MSNLRQDSNATLLLHQDRLRIVEAFLGDRELTTADLRSELPDIPPASLYRHLSRLIDAGVLDVVAERKVRGTVERTYAKHRRLNVSGDDLATLTRDELRQTYFGYVATLLADIDRYLERDDSALRRGGATFRVAALWLTDEELNELAVEYAKLLDPYLHRRATPERARRIVRTIVLPAPEETPPETAT